MFSSVITGTGCYIPSHVETNEGFTRQEFYSSDQSPLTIPSSEVVEKFKKITGIEERRYADDSQNASDMGSIAAEAAIIDSGIDRETIDQLIVAHNFGDVVKHTIQTDAVPALAARIKQVLGIRNPACVAYDILFGCPGWVQGLIHADAFFKAGIAQKALIIGTETLSRVIDMYDRDSMIFSDGAGAAVVEYKASSPGGPGILGTAAMTHSVDEADYINMGPSYYPGSNTCTQFLKMKGRKVYEYAVKYVPAAMKECLEKSGVGIGEVKKIFIHQANEKMDEAMIEKLYQLYGMKTVPKDIMPMSIHWLGNSSVATVPTLFDLVRKELVPGHSLHPGDVILFASVGAGMNINAVCYRY